jgi:hypothetical protein
MQTIHRQAVGVIVAAAAVIAVIPVRRASATSGGVDRSAIASRMSPVQVRTPHGVAGWVSKAYIDAHPEYLGKVRPRLSASVSTNFRAIPASHFGCTQGVCIDVRGRKLQVDHWYTTAYGNRGCIKPFYDIRHGVGVRTLWGPLVCPSTGGDSVYYDYSVDPSGNYFNGDQLCNGWTKMAGYACASIIG